MTQVEAGAAGMQQQQQLGTSTRITDTVILERSNVGLRDLGKQTDTPILRCSLILPSATGSLHDSNMGLKVVVKS
jgi:hypothetical protein